MKTVTCPACGNLYDAYNDRTPCPNCVRMRKDRECQFDMDRTKLENLYAEWNTMSTQNGDPEATLAKKREYNEQRRFMMDEYGTISGI